MSDPAAKSPRTIGVGVVGLGLMGRVHIEAYAAAAREGLPCRLVAVSDRRHERLTGRAAPGGNVQADAAGKVLFDPARVAVTADPREVFANDEVELVSICTPTDSHVELAIAALRSGKHVLVEKPVSLDPDEIDRLAAVAIETRRMCMPAMCMRFWPGWSWLADAVRDARYGRVTSAAFQRLGSRPTWGEGFYSDSSRSGGALFDLHVHDVDIVRSLFGDPDAVHSSGTRDHLTTLFRYSHGPAHVTAEGGWDHAPGFAFRMRYVVNFERATAEFDSRRDSPLEITVGGAVEAVDTGAGTGYDGEIRHALKCVAEGRTRAAVDLTDSAGVTRILLAELASLNRK
ncbi:MAG: Gfo/Idh/MocA family oxidoreductase [Planctomycetes bacterium]|nr:Gfo/Idh/MocA family oxidoreductase [Planctomycetota bacterium]